MIDPRQRVIDAILDRLPDEAELRTHATGLLEAEIARPSEAEAEGCVERLARGGSSRRWVWLTLAASAIVAGCIAAPVIGTSVLSHLKVRFGFGPSVNDHRRAFLSEQEAVLVFGDPERGLSPAEAAFELDPDSPAAIADLLAERQREGRPLPDELIKAGTDNDPENGWFPLLAAAERAGTAIREIPAAEMEGPPEPEKRAIARKGYEVVDEQAFEEAWSLVVAASRSDRIDSYAYSVLTKRMKALESIPASMEESMLRAMDVVARTLTWAGYREPSKLARIKAAQAVTPEEWRQLSETWSLLLRKRASQPMTSLTDALVLSAIALEDAEWLEGSARRLALHEEADRWAAFREWRREFREAADSPEKKAEADLTFQRGSIMSRISLPMVSKSLPSAEPLAEDDLRPARMAEHHWAGKLMAMGMGVVLMAFAGFTAAIRWRTPLASKVAKPLLRLFSIPDHLLLASCGVLLPLGLVWIITWATPFGLREWGLSSMGFRPWSGQVTAIFYLCLLAPIFAIDFLLRNRRALFDWPKRGALSGMGVLACIGSLIFFGLEDPKEPTWKISTLIAALWLLLAQLTILFLIGRTVFGRRRHQLRRQVKACLLAPCYLLAALAFIGSVPVHAEREAAWLERDQLIFPRSEAVGMSPYESRITEGLRLELLRQFEKL